MYNKKAILISKFQDKQHNCEVELLIAEDRKNVTSSFMICIAQEKFSIYNLEQKQDNREAKFIITGIKLPQIDQINNERKALFTNSSSVNFV